MNYEHEQGTCPNCNSQAISYGNLAIGFYNDCFRDAECDDCGTSYQEWYDLKFSGLYNININNNFKLED